MDHLAFEEPTLNPGQGFESMLRRTSKCLRDPRSAQATGTPHGCRRAVLSQLAAPAAPRPIYGPSQPTRSGAGLRVVKYCTTERFCLMGHCMRSGRLPLGEAGLQIAAPCREDECL